MSRISEIGKQLRGQRSLWVITNLYYMEWKMHVQATDTGPSIAVSIPKLSSSIKIYFNMAWHLGYRMRSVLISEKGIYVCVSLLLVSRARTHTCGDVKIGRGSELVWFRAGCTTTTASRSCNHIVCASCLHGEWKHPFKPFKDLITDYRAKWGHCILIPVLEWF